MSTGYGACVVTRRTVAATLAVGAVVAGAGLGFATFLGFDQPAPVPPAVQSAPVTRAVPATQTPTGPATLTREAAGGVYTRAVAPLNDAVKALDEQERRKTRSLTQMRAAAQRAADAVVVFVRSMRGTDWPTDVEPLAADVAADAARLIAPLREASESRSLAEYDAVVWPVEDGAAAQVLRAELGLPEAPR